MNGWKVLVWAPLVMAAILWTAVFWATSPTHCSAPDRHGHVRCDPGVLK